MDDCFICCESPCTCLTSEPVRKAKARASRRLPAQPASAVRIPVRKFSSAPARAPAEKQEVDQVETVDLTVEDDDLVLKAAILCFAPLLSDSELRRHNVERSSEVTSLEERRAEFRANVVWSEARYG